MAAFVAGVDELTTSTLPPSCPQCGSRKPPLPYDAPDPKPGRPQGLKHLLLCPECHYPYSQWSRSF